MDGRRGDEVDAAAVPGVERARATQVHVDRVAQLSAQVHALTAQLAAAVGEAVEVGAWEGWGMRSAAHWLTITGGWTLVEAQRLVRVAGAREDLAPLVERAERGELSASWLDAAARVATPELLPQLAHLADTCTTTQALRVIGTYRSLRAAGEREGAVEPRPEYWWRQWNDAQGRGRLDAALSPSVAEVLGEAFAAAAHRAAGERAEVEASEGDAATAEPAGSSSPEDAGDPAPRSGPRWYPPRTGPEADEAAGSLARSALESSRRQGVRRTGGESYGVLVTVDLATLARVLDLPDAGRALSSDPLYRLGSATFTRSGRRLGDDELRRLLPDSVLQVIVTAEGLPLWMGTEHRFANLGQRRALLVRGHGRCEVPGCTNRVSLDAHHVVESCRAGPTCLCNLLHVCGAHHRQLHAERWRVETEPGSQRFTFFAADGRCLGSTSPRGRPPDLDRPRRGAERRSAPSVGADSLRKTGGGEPLTAYGLDVLLHALLTA